MGGGFTFSLEFANPVDIANACYNEEKYCQRTKKGKVFVEEKGNSKRVGDVKQDPVLNFPSRQQPHTRPGGGANPCIPCGYRGWREGYQDNIKDKPSAEHDCRRDKPLRFRCMTYFYRW